MYTILDQPAAQLSVYCTAQSCVTIPKTVLQILGMIMSKTLILCDCLSSQTVDAAALSKATGLACAGCHTSLCTSQIDIAAKAIEAGDVVIACLQEAQRFAEVAEELEVGAPQFIDIRDRAGWTDDTAPTTPKMAALIADGMLPEPTYRSVDVISEGTCLITGAPRRRAGNCPIAGRSVVSDGSADVRRGYSTDT